MKKIVNLNKNRLHGLYWTDKLSLPKIAERYRVNVTSILDRMKKYNIRRRTFSESNYIASSHKPKFILKKHLNNEEKMLKIAGIMLYWAEGTLKNATVDFANSNSQMIKIFLKFLRNICGINENRLRIYLYAYSYQNITALKSYWHKITNIPLEQFTRPYIRKGNPNKSERKLLYGLVHIRYNDKRLLEKINSWIQEYIISSNGGAGTKAAKWNRL